jgi:hypothetical protein
MLLKLSEPQKTLIVNAAETIRIGPMREAFFRAVHRALSTAPTPITTNDCLRSVQMALEYVPTADILTGRTIGPADNPDNEYVRQTARRY